MYDFLLFVGHGLCDRATVAGGSDTSASGKYVVLLVYDRDGRQLCQIQVHSQSIWFLCLIHIHVKVIPRLEVVGITQPQNPTP